METAPKDQSASKSLWKRLLTAVLLSMAAYAAVTLLTWNLNEQARRMSFTPMGVTQSNPVNQACFISDPDSCYWVHYTGQVLKDGGWGVNWTDSDNAPYGREVHWSPVPIWWLAFLSQFFTGSVDSRLNWAAYLANPVLFFLSMSAIAIAIFRRFGPGIALIVWLSILGSPTFWAAFQPTRAGHLSWQFLTSLGTIFCLAAANFGYLCPKFDCSKPLLAEQIRNRRWFILSGLSTGIGLYLGMPNTILTVIPVVTVSIVLAITLRGSPHFQAECWQFWAVFAAGSSFTLYLIQYWPRLPMRLEVNHPLYSIALLAAGFFVAGFRDLWIKRTSQNFIRAVIPISILLGTAAVVAFAPLDWLYLRDPYMLKLHRNIQEFQPLLHSRSELLLLIFYFGPAFFASLIGVTVLVRRRNWSYQEGLFLGSALGCAILAAASLAQARWHLYFSVAAIPLVISAYQLSFEPAIRLKLTFLLNAAVPIITGFFLLDKVGYPAYLTITNGFAPETVQALVSREMVRLVRAQTSSRSQPSITLTDWNSAPYFVLYGEKVIASLYWENIAGIQAYHNILENPDLDAARKLMEDRRIDFLAASCPLKKSTTLPDGPGHHAAEGNELVNLLHNPKAVPPSWLQPVKVEQIQVGAEKFELRLYQPTTSAKMITGNE
jgi:hypothetical protein